jgi:hypothetical protein
MSDTDNGGPAFPTHEFHHNQMMPVGGMTLRDYFAAKAMQGYIASHSGPECCTPDYEQTAQESYAFADAMLKARQP